LTIADHAQVSSQIGIIGSTGTALVAITGGASWAASLNLIVGGFNGGTSTMLVENGGTVTSMGGVIGSNGGTSTVTVTGAGSSWTLSQDLYLGGDAANFTAPAIGVLNVANGGTVSAASLRIATDILGNGTLNIGAPVGSAPVAPGTSIRRPSCSATVRAQSISTTRPTTMSSRR
jgi:T5SS/PEP-CTERM-associated repeat protein